MNGVIGYIEGLDLPAPSRAVQRHEAPAAFGTAGQAVTIGAEMTEFSDHVPQAFRPAISNGLLLAQLAADKAASGGGDPWTWFTTYNGVLDRIGWLPTVGEINQQVISDRNAELHKAIIPIVTAVFGPAIAAGSILIEVLKGLQSMNADLPWLTLFERKSRNVTAAKFGVSYVDSGDGQGAALKTVFFGLQARQVITQVLFLKTSTADATVRSAQAEAILSAQVIAASGAALAQKVEPFIVDNIKNIDI
jgi:hypothetical protein